MFLFCMITYTIITSKTGIRKGEIFMINNNAIRVKADEVEPIKNIKDIMKVKQYLIGTENKLDYMLFTVGVSMSD